ncbi:MAG: hypothetical protein K0R41_2472 [Geminicoccaceae bacterium]|nr:hypothetical protein [Geminicoccaceae bacterium]
MPGQLWKVEIPKAIRQAGIFLACLSSRSVEKVGFVQNEFRLALSAFGERPPESIWLIPVRLDDCAVPDLRIPDLGLSLQDIQWVDLWQEGEFDRLVKSIEQTLRGGTPPPEAVRKEAASTSSPSEPVKLIEPNDKDGFLSQPVNQATLADYTKWKYPGLPLNQEIQDLLFRDLAHSRFVTLRDVDRAVDTATVAVECYRKENPGMLEAGTDYITKSLGFVDKDFRARHRFSPRTREAFSKYEHLVRPHKPGEAARDEEGIDAPLGEAVVERPPERKRGLRGDRSGAQP